MQKVLIPCLMICLISGRSSAVEKNTDAKLPSLETKSTLFSSIGKLASLAPDSRKLEDNPREKFVLKPEEEGPRAVVAWRYFRKDNKAYKEFHSPLLSTEAWALFGRALSSIEGLPGFTWGMGMRDLTGNTGTGVSTFIQQGINWINLPGNVMLITFVEYRYKSRTRDRRYFDENGTALGLEFRQSIFRIGAEYSWLKYPEQSKTDITRRANLQWYYDWYKYMRRRADDRWFQITAFSGYTWGRITHDLDKLTGTSISGFVNQGIDWFTLPGLITFNTYAEYRFGFRSKDKLWYNSHGPALGIELQKPPFKLGMDYFWENYTERKVTERRWRLYLGWYHDWDLKPGE